MNDEEVKMLLAYIHREKEEQQDKIEAKKVLENINSYINGGKKIHE